MTAEKEPLEEIAAGLCILIRERRFVRAGAKGDLVLTDKRLRGCGVPDPREFTPMQQQAHLGRGAWSKFNAGLCAGREQVHEAVHAGAAALDGGGAGERMHEPGLHIAGIGRIDSGQFLGALVEKEELKVGDSAVEEGDAPGRGAACARRDDDLEHAKVAAAVGVLATVVQPEDAEGENTVDGCGRLLRANADDSLGNCAAQQTPAHIGRTKAVLKVHRVAKALDFRFREVALEKALQQAQVVAAGCVAGRRRTTVTSGDEFKSLGCGAPRRRVIRRRQYARSCTSTTVRIRFRSSLQNCTRQRPCDSVTE